MFRPKHTKNIDDIKNARSIKELNSVLHRIGSEVKQRKSIILRLVSKIKKLFSRSTTEKIEIGDADIDISKLKTGVTFSPGTGNIVIEGWKQPQTKKIMDLIFHIEEFYQSAYELTALRSVLVKQYPGLKESQQTAYKAVTNYLEQVSESLKDTVEALEAASKAIEKEHSPPALKSFALSVYKHLGKNLDKDYYDSIKKPRLYVSESTKGNVVFHYYIEIEGLVNTEEYEFPEYYTVISGEINPTGVMEVYVTTLKEFGVPGKFHLGRKIKNKNDLLVKSLTMIAADKAVTALEKLPISVERSRIAARLKPIKEIINTEIDNDSLIITLNKNIGKQTQTNTNRIREIVKEVLTAFDILLENVRRKRIRLHHKVELSPSGNPTISVMLTPIKHETKINDTVTKTQFDQVTSALGLDKKTSDELKSFLAKR